MRMTLQVTSKVDIDDNDVYTAHAKLIENIANVILAKQEKVFVFDDNNKNVYKFLLRYFNGSKQAKEVFPEFNHSLDKSIMLVGGTGTGKSLTMQIFSEYLRITGNEAHKFFNVSVTQMVNYYQKHGHIDAFTYRESGASSFEGKPVNVCLNDVGLQTYRHFGTDTKVFVEDFLHARNELWAMEGKHAHITTNLPPKELSQYFQEVSVNPDGTKTVMNRLVDRFKTYNVLYLMGESRR